jgi:AraC-like DNA-binding protein
MEHQSRLEWIKDWEAEARNANYQACVLVKRLTVSERQLRRYFVRRFGMPTQTWMDHLRLRKSIELLQSGRSVKEIAFSLGYKHSSRFCEAFKREYGTTATASFTRSSMQTSARRNECPQAVS